MPFRRVHVLAVLAAIGIGSPAVAQVSPPPVLGSTAVPVSLPPRIAPPHSPTLPELPSPTTQGRLVGLTSPPAGIPPGSEADPITPIPFPGTPPAPAPTPEHRRFALLGSW